MTDPILNGAAAVVSQPAGSPLVRLECDDAELRAALAVLLSESGLGPAAPTDRAAVLLRVLPPHDLGPLPSGAAEVVRHHQVGVWRVGDDLWLADDASRACLRVPSSVMELVPAPSMAARQPFASANLLIVYGILTLLRWHGLFALHAAAVSPDERGCLLVGASGTGKSTMTLRLVREGWSYLSDDSVLLRGGPTVETLALRRRLTIKKEADATGLAGQWQRTETAAGPLLRPVEDGGLEGSRRTTVVPRLLVFPSLSGQPRSRIETRDPAAALLELVQQSTLTELEPSQAPVQLDLLRDLIRQCRAVWMVAGLDVYREPGALAALLTTELDRHA